MAKYLLTASVLGLLISSSSCTFATVGGKELGLDSLGNLPEAAGALALAPIVYKALTGATAESYEWLQQNTKSLEERKEVLRHLNRAVNDILPENLLEKCDRLETHIGRTEDASRPILEGWIWDHGATDADADEAIALIKEAKKSPIFVDPHSNTVLESKWKERGFQAADGGKQAAQEEKLRRNVYFAASALSACIGLSSVVYPPAGAGVAMTYGLRTFYSGISTLSGYFSWASHNLASGDEEVETELRKLIAELERLQGINRQLVGYAYDMNDILKKMGQSVDNFKRALQRDHRMQKTDEERRNYLRRESSKCRDTAHAATEEHNFFRAKKEVKKLKRQLLQNFRSEK